MAWRISLSRVDSTQVVIGIHLGPSFIWVVARALGHLQLLIGAHALVGNLLHLLHVGGGVCHPKRVVGLLLLLVHPLILEASHHSAHRVHLVLLVLHEVVVIYNRRQLHAVLAGIVL